MLPGPGRDQLDVIALGASRHQRDAQWRRSPWAQATAGVLRNVRVDVDGETAREHRARTTIPAPATARIAANLARSTASRVRWRLPNERVAGGGSRATPGRCCAATGRSSSYRYE